MKLSREVLQQVLVRKAALQSANVLFQMAQREYGLYVNEQLQLLGLDVMTTTQYSVDDQTGAVLQVKAEPVLKKEEKDDSKASGESPPERSE